jgi:hypothetical protein
VAVGPVELVLPKVSGDNEFVGGIAAGRRSIEVNDRRMFPEAGLVEEAAEGRWCT